MAALWAAFIFTSVTLTGALQMGFYDLFLGSDMNSDSVRQNKSPMALTSSFSALKNQGFIDPIDSLIKNDWQPGFISDNLASLPGNLLSLVETSSLQSKTLLSSSPESITSRIISSRLPSLQQLMSQVLRDSEVATSNADFLIGEFLPFIRQADLQVEIWSELASIPGLIATGPADTAFPPLDNTTEERTGENVTARFLEANSDSFLDSVLDLQNVQNKVQFVTSPVAGPFESADRAISLLLPQASFRKLQSTTASTMPSSQVSQSPDDNTTSLAEQSKSSSGDKLLSDEKQASQGQEVNTKIKQLTDTGSGQFLSSQYVPALMPSSQGFRLTYLNRANKLIDDLLRGHILDLTTNKVMFSSLDPATSRSLQHNDNIVYVVSVDPQLQLLTLDPVHINAVSLLPGMKHREMTPSEADDTTPEQDTDDAISEQETDDETPGQETEDTTPGQETDDTTPGHETDDTTLGQETYDTTPGQETDDMTPGQKTDDTTPGQETDNTTLRQETEDTTPGQETDDTTPGQPSKPSVSLTQTSSPESSVAITEGISTETVENISKVTSGPAVLGIPVPKPKLEPVLKDTSLLLTTDSRVMDSTWRPASIPRNSQNISLEDLVAAVGLFLKKSTSGELSSSTPKADKEKSRGLTPDSYSAEGTVI